MSRILNKRDPDRWSDDKVELLKKLWAEGLPLTGIAEQLGPGFTKGMVAGRRWKLRLPERPSPFKPDGPAAPPITLVTSLAASETAPPPSAPSRTEVYGPPAPTEREKAAAHIPHEEGRCSYIVGAIGKPNFGYCRNRAVEKSIPPLCDTHLHFFKLRQNRVA